MANDPLYMVMRNYRVIPVIASSVFGYLLIDCYQWYVSLESPSVEQSGFASVVIAAAAAWFKFYVESGRLKDV